LTFHEEHLGLAMFTIIPVFAGLWYVINEWIRTHPPKDQRGRDRRPPRSARQRLRRVVRDGAAIVVALDRPWWRILYVLLGGAAVYLPIQRFPLSVDTFAAFPEEHAMVVAAQALAPAVILYTVLFGRIAYIRSRR